MSEARKFKSRTNLRPRASTTAGPGLTAGDHRLALQLLEKDSPQATPPSSSVIN